MKTTLDIADPLLKEAKALARTQGVTIRALVERGLQLALAERRDGHAFKLRDESVNGTGLHADTIGRSWADLRTLIYQDRGG